MKKSEIIIQLRLLQMLLSTGKATHKDIMDFISNLLKEIQTKK